MRVATDIGGTFTDIVYIDKNGEIGVDKSHTTPPEFEKGVIDVIQKTGIDTKEIESFIHGTTVIINALTERKGAKTALITTKGFRDVLDIQRGNRPDLFNLRYKKPESFVPRYLRQEVEERVNYKGEILTPLNRKQVEACVAYFKKEKVEAIAVAYMHAYINDTHEKETIEMIKELWPEIYVTGSHEVTKEWREYERTNTAVLNSFVKPVASQYINRLYNELEGIGLSAPKYIMQSNGGTTTFDTSKETPINMVESGPVAGIFGSAMIGKLLGMDKVIGFDIGGTTAKCSLVDGGEVKVTTEYKIHQTTRFAGYPIKTPVVDIVEIGNGGGSIAWIDDAGSLRVGPQSAGALPGPVAYGKGGENPTTTDANLVLGRLSPKNFDVEVDMEKVRQAIKEKIAQPFNISVEEAALGIVRIANSNMLNALKIVSVRKGHDPREFAMIAFGGGGGMHAAVLAKELGIGKVIIPIAAPVFSALGMLMTDLRQDDINTFNIRLDKADYSDLENKWKSMEKAALTAYEAKNIEEENIMFVRNLDMRYWGQEHTVKVQVPNVPVTDKNVKDIIERFHIEHNKAYSFRMDDSMVEIVNLHLVTLGKVEKTELKKLKKATEDAKYALKEERDVIFEEVGMVKTKIYDLKAMSPGMKIMGPAIVEETSSSTLIYPNMKAELDEYGNLIIDTEVK
jgi:N-methylhydantoinase A